MGLFDNFKPAAPAAPATSANHNSTVPSTSTVPAQVVATATDATGAAKPAAPLDNYNKLWENDPNAKKSEPFTINSDPAQLLEAAKTVDFTKTLTPELHARIKAGGEDAQLAMVEAMNAVSQLTYAQSAHAAAKIAEQAMQKQQAAFEASLPDIIKRHSVSDNLRTTNPLMSNPAMAPMVDALQAQFTRKYPQATATEIQAHVNDFLNGAADMITAQRPQPKTSKGREDQDWSKFA